MTSSRAKTTKQSASTDSDFVLKHRIAGAAFLLFFGALILPYLLGAPADSNQLKAQTNATNNRSGDVDVQGSASAEDVLLEAIESEDNRVEEKVYISKITPLNVNDDEQAQSTEVTVAEPGSVLDDQELAMLEQLDRQQSEASKNTKPEEQKSSPSNNVNSQAASKPASAPASSSAELASAASSTPATKKSIDVGWVVQVGVFTDKTGAARVVSDLRSKGFAPSTTIVDTNRGKATGTRIWLGPYEQRVEAAKAKTLLTSKTGEAGFIRAYP